MKNEPVQMDTDMVDEDSVAEVQSQFENVEFERYQRYNRASKRWKTFYRCQHAGCSRTYGKKSNFVAHQRVHSGIKPFACTFCSLTFSQSGTLNRHMRLKHPAQDFM